MFKIPTYDELEKKEKEQNEKNKEIKSSLFEKRKLVTLDDTYNSQGSTKPSTSGLKVANKNNENKKSNSESPEKRQKTIEPVVIEDDTQKEDDDDSLLMAFIDEKKGIIDQSPKLVKTNEAAVSDGVFRVPVLPTASTMGPSKILPPNASNTNTNAAFSSSGALLVNSKQKGNPILKHVRNVQWKYSDTLVPDYCMSRNSCAFFLSMKYHLLNPTYIHQRVKELGKAYDLRVLLVQVDVKEPRHCIKELEKIAIYSNLTMILCWTPEEVLKSSFTQF